MFNQNPQQGNNFVSTSLPRLPSISSLFNEAPHQFAATPQQQQPTLPSFKVFEQQHHNMFPQQGTHPSHLYQPQPQQQHPSFQNIFQQQHVHQPSPMPQQQPIIPQHHHIHSHPPMMNLPPHQHHQQQQHPHFQPMFQQKHVYNVQAPSVPPPAAVSPMPPTPVHQESLKVTLESQEDGSRLYYCTLEGCQKVFTRKTDLQTHQRTHSGERPFTCSQAFCGKKFTTISNLRRHERIHTGERPYVCDVCNKGFTQSSHLKRHFLSHNK